MDLIIQVGIIVIAIAFIVLMYSIIQTIKVLKAAIEEMRLMLGQVREDVSHISGDMKEAIQNTNAMTLDVRKKLSSLNILFTTVNDIGQTLHTFTGIAKKSATKVATSMHSSSPAASVSTNGKQQKKNDHVTSAIIDGLISTLRIVKKIKQV